MRATLAPQNQSLVRPYLFCTGTPGRESSCCSVRCDACQSPAPPNTRSSAPPRPAGPWLATAHLCQTEAATWHAATALAPPADGHRAAREHRCRATRALPYHRAWRASGVCGHARMLIPLTTNIRRERNSTPPTTWNTPAVGCVRQACGGPRATASPLRAAAALAASRSLCARLARLALKPGGPLVATSARAAGLSNWPAAGRCREWAFRNAFRLC